MSFDLELRNRRALVTGGTKGVGAAVGAALVEAGVAVVATARTVPDDTAGVHYVAADITTADGSARVVQEVLTVLGGIDILVNVLGGSRAHVTSIQHALPLPESTTAAALAGLRHPGAQLRCGRPRAAALPSSRSDR